MNKKYELVQGTNFIKIPALNIKKLLDTQEMIKNIEKEDGNYLIKTLFENIRKEPNFVNIKNPSNDCVLYFSSRKDVSRQIYDFRVFPKQEIDYYLHEAKHFWCYVTQLNSSISLDINFDYVTKIRNNYSVDNQSKYECLKLIDGVAIADTITEETDIFYNTSWVKNCLVKVNTNQNYDLYLTVYDSVGNSVIETLVSGGTSTSGIFENISLIPSVTENQNGILGHGFKFGLKNVSGGASMTASLSVELFS